MMGKVQIQEEIDKILADKRLAYKTASILINAPLALIQLGLEVRLHTLQEVLGVPKTNIRELRGEGMVSRKTNS